MPISQSFVNKQKQIFNQYIDKYHDEIIQYLKNSLNGFIVRNFATMYNIAYIMVTILLIMVCALLNMVFTCLYLSFYYPAFRTLLYGLGFIWIMLYNLKIYRENFVDRLCALKDGFIYMTDRFLVNIYKKVSADYISKNEIDDMLYETHINNNI